MTPTSDGDGEGGGIGDLWSPPPPSASIQNDEGDGGIEEGVGAPAPSAASPASTPARVEQIDDGAVPTAETTMAAAATLETTKGSGGGERRPAGLEQIVHDDDGLPPAPGATASSLFDDDNVRKKMQEGEAGGQGNNFFTSVGEPWEIAPPAPFNAADVPGERDSDLQPTFISSPRFMRLGAARGRGAKGVPPSVATTSEPIVQAEEGNVLRAGVEQIDDVEADSAAAALVASDEGNLQQASNYGEITEAYVVDDEIHIATPAEPTVPWWKQRRTKILLVVVLGVLLALAIVVWQLVSQANAPTPSPAPSISPVPTIDATTSPSSSQVPSSSPSACSYKVLSDVQTLDLLRPNPDTVRTAVDGGNLIVVSRDVTSEAFGWRGDTVGTLYVMFFTLGDDGKWERVGSFLEGDTSWGSIHGFDWMYDVAISGRAAVVGLPTEDRVNVYRQNSFGLWAKVASPEHSGYGGCGYGKLVEIDDNLMVVGSRWECYSSASPNSVHVFRWGGDKWGEVGMIEGDSIGDAAIRENTIIVYDCYRDNSPESYWADSSGACVDHERRYAYDPKYDNITQISDEGSFVDAPTDGDIQAFGEGNRTVIYALQSDGTWDEQLVLDELYDSYAMSGRTLVVTADDEVYSMDISDCTQEVPTSTPTASLSPTTCYEVEFVFHSDGPGDWGANLQRLEGGGFVAIETFADQGQSDDWSCVYWEQTFYSVCLNEGRYQFIYQGIGHEGQMHAVHYEVRTSDGQVIAREGDLPPTEMISQFSEEEYSSMHAFDIPYDPSATATSPTGRPYRPWAFTRSPTASPAPDISPQPPVPSSLEPSASLPDGGPFATACLTQSECEEQLPNVVATGFQAGIYPDHGCFVKGNILFWGVGGTAEQMVVSPLGGVKKRVWCG